MAVAKRKPELLDEVAKGGVTLKEAVKIVTPATNTAPATPVPAEPTGDFSKHYLQRRDQLIYHIRSEIQYVGFMDDFHTGDEYRRDLREAIRHEVGRSAPATVPEPQSPPVGSVLPAEYIHAKRNLVEEIRLLVAGYEPWREELLCSLIHEAEQFQPEPQPVDAEQAATRRTASRARRRREKGSR